MILAQAAGEMLMIGGGLIAAAGLFGWRRVRISRLHRKNIARSRVVLEKLRSIDGDRRGARMITYLRKIDPLVFEELLLTALESAGYEVKRNRRYTGDGGIDGHVIVHGRGAVPVQAKRYSNGINPAHVRAFAEHAKPVGLGLFIHTGKTGAAARAHARSSGCIHVISGQRLVDLIDGADPLQSITGDKP